jgi:hypothetical protein
MSSQLSKRLIAPLICLVVVIIVVVLLRGIGFEKYRDNKVVAGEIRRPWDVFAAHISRPQYLTVAGKTYRGIRGLAPYYLDVPGTNSILFVTQATGDHITFHLLNLNTKEEVQIDGGTCGFGWGIGGSRKPGEKFTDYIESADSNRITVAIHSGDWKETLVLNLVTKSIERVETVYFNASGQVTNRSVRTL